MKRLFVLLLILLALVFVWETGEKYLPAKTLQNIGSTQEKVKVVSEESVVIDVVKKVSPSVVTVGVEQNPSTGSTDIGPFSIFFQQPQAQSDQTQKDNYIGSGFVIQKNGLIVTNKHVVSDTNLKYFIVDNKGNKYQISNIYRDPLNDIAIIKVSNPPQGGFQEIEMGDSSKLEVGQLAIAIGTPLGEFRNTVTQGVVSGLGRGITAGSPYEGYVERLDNVIQTDAAINPGNSGGPLLNSEGQVIGVNTAIASGGQNLGFAIPINVIKDSVNNFNATGQFSRPYVGVAYTMIDKQTAILNSLPEGAYVQEVVSGSAAEKAGVQKDDIITKVDGKSVSNTNGGLASTISKKKIGDKITLTIYRDGKTMDLTVTLTEAPAN